MSDGIPPAWVIRAASEVKREDLNIKRGLASMGWGDIPNLRDVACLQELEVMLHQEFPYYQNGTATDRARMLWQLRSDVGVGDLVVMPLNTGRKKIALGTVTAGYWYNVREPDPEWRHVVSVDWKRPNFPRADAKRDLLDSLSKRRAIYPIRHQGHVGRLQQVMHKGRDPGQRRTVP